MAVSRVPSRTGRLPDLKAARSASTAWHQRSAQSEARGVYRDMLERTQKSTLDITDWLEWFLACLDRAITATEATLGAVFRKATFWDKHAGGTINERQKKMLNKLFDGFEGKLTSTKWAIIAKCSQDTAQRDIQSLVDQGIPACDTQHALSQIWRFVAPGALASERIGTPLSGQRGSNGASGSSRAVAV